MNAKTHIYAVGNVVGTPQGNGKVVSITGGWTTVDVNGTSAKFRNSAITAPGSTSAAASMADVKARVPERKQVVTDHTPKAELKPPKPARAKKAKAEPKPRVKRAPKEIDPDSPFANLGRMRERCRTEADGEAHFDNGDELATKLRGMPIDQIYALAKKTFGVDFHPQYKHLNPGMQRMNLGNRLRAALRAAQEEAKAK
jgi:hypothetical protein